ncbi:hypothetical protein ACOAPY_14080 [Pseudomonas sp. P3C3]
MLDWVAGAVESTKAAFGITKAMIAQRDEGLVQERVFELNSLLAGLQQQMLQGQLEQMQLIDELRELKRELDAIKSARDEDGLYERYQLERGPFVYKLIAERDPEKISHLLCSVCFEKDRRHVTLHTIGSFYVCPACDTKLRFKKDPPLNTSAWR